MKQGLELLNAAQNNVEAAAAQFEDNCLVVIVAKTGISPELGRHFLKDNQFDIRATLLEIERTQFSLSERILNRYANPATALSMLQSAIENKMSSSRKNWFTLSELQQLNRAQYTFMLVLEWMNYEEWEDFYCALSFNIASVSEVIEIELGLPAVAARLRAAGQRYAQLRDKSAKPELAGQLATLYADNQLTEFEQEYQLAKSTLENRLLQYVKEHIGAFP